MHHVYIIQAKDHSHPSGGHVKIGVSRDPLRRIAELQTGNPHPLLLLGLLASGVTQAEARKVEAEAHTRHAVHRLEGEWFNLPNPAALLGDPNRDASGWLMPGACPNCRDTPVSYGNGSTADPFYFACFTCGREAGARPDYASALAAWNESAEIRFPYRSTRPDPSRQKVDAFRRMCQAARAATTPRL